jgi:hypothetical protein
MKILGRRTAKEPQRDQGEGALRLTQVGIIDAISGA